MRHAALFFALASVASGASGCAATAENGPGHDAVSAARAAAADTTPAAVQPLSLPAGAKRFVVVGSRAPLKVSGHDSVLGDHVLTFDRWWAHIDADPPRITVEIDLTSLRSNEDLVETIVRNHLLEVDKFERASLVGTLSATARGDRIVIDSVADIHGTRSALRFSGEIRPEGEGVRFFASFDMSRSAFGLWYAPAEPFLDDTFRITVNAVATPERVVIEEL